MEELRKKRASLQKEMEEMQWRAREEEEVTARERREADLREREEAMKRAKAIRQAQEEREFRGKSATEFLY